MESRSLLPLWSQVRVLWLLIWWPLKTYMVVNFRAHGISRGTRKLLRIFTLIKKKTILFPRNIVRGALLLDSWISFWSFNLLLSFNLFLIKTLSQSSHTLIFIGLDFNHSPSHISSYLSLFFLFDESLFLRVTVLVLGILIY